MCGRLKMASDYSELKIRFHISDVQQPVNIQPRYNAAPTSDLPVVLLDEHGGRAIQIMRWGLVPFWAKDIKIGYSTFNAKAEGIEAKPTFRDAFKRRRCLVPVDLFYEWHTHGPKEKQPYAIALADRRIMALAGLHESWKSPAGEVVKSFTIVTTEANAQMAALHGRMPVILDEPAWATWLGEQPATLEPLKSIMVPFAGELALWRVDKRVGNVRNEDVEIADPIGL